MYRPRLNYLFIVANKRSLWPQVSLIRYLNQFGICPSVLCQLPDVARIIQSEGVSVSFVDEMNKISSTGCTVAFSQSAGLDQFERDCLDRSKSLGMTNVKLHNSMSTYNTLFNVNYARNRVNGRIHGVCMKEQRAILHFKKFLHDVWYLNTGDPDWDYFKTQEFSSKVEEMRGKYGDKVLLICASFDGGQEEKDFWSLIIKWTIDLGFKVLIRVHPGLERQIPPNLVQYIAPNVHRHVAFASASHILSEMSSTVVGESMMLGTKVGSYPFVPHHFKYGSHTWIDNDKKWHDAMFNQVGDEMLGCVPYVHTTATLMNFLSSPDPMVTQEQADKLWGWPRVDCYSEYLFKCVEEKLGVK